MDAKTTTKASDSLESLERNAADVSIRWAKTGNGYQTMQDAVNKYIDATGANCAIGNDHEAIRLGREAAALRIDIESIHALTKEQEQRLHDALMKIANGLGRHSQTPRHPFFSHRPIFPNPLPAPSTPTDHPKMLG